MLDIATDVDYEGGEVGSITVKVFIPWLEGRSRPVKLPLRYWWASTVPWARYHLQALLAGHLSCPLLLHGLVKCGGHISLCCTELCLKCPIITHFHFHNPTVSEREKNLCKLLVLQELTRSCKTLTCHVTLTPRFHCIMKTRIKLIRA